MTNSSEDPISSIAGDLEISQWLKYQKFEAGAPDLKRLCNPRSDKKKNSKAIKNDSRVEFVSSDIDQEELKLEDIVSNLKLRWKNQLPYTAIGSEMLISINSCDINRMRKSELLRLEKLNSKNESEIVSDLSVEQQMDDYCFLSSINHHDNSACPSEMLLSDPRGRYPILENNMAHILSFGTRCYWRMLRQNENQAIVLTGQSGSGKTETTKVLIRQFENLSRNYGRIIGKGKSHDGKLLPEDTKNMIRMMSWLSVLESFCHAKTDENSNSSRVHQVTEIQFNKHGIIVGADLSYLLLEKNRVQINSSSEFSGWNFNIFYDLFEPESLSDVQKKECMLLDSPSSYSYLRPKSHSWYNKSLLKYRDRTKFQSLRKLLKAAGISSKYQLEIFKLLSAIILLGNVEFEKTSTNNQENSAVKNMPVLETCAKLLGVVPEALITCLTQRISHSGKLFYAGILNTQQACLSRDRLANSLYNMLFETLVNMANQKLNLALDPSNLVHNTVSIVDFSGFKSYFDTSSSEAAGFWQFMTNYADEKLNQWTKKSIFKTHLTDISQQKSQIQDSIKQSRSLLNGIIKLYISPISGIVTLLDAETEQYETKGEEDQENMLTFLYERAQTSISQGVKNAENSLNEMKVENSAFYVSKNSKKNRRVFGIRHYGGLGNPDSHQSPHNCLFKYYYDTNDFIEYNFSDGRTKFMLKDQKTLITGSSDFPASRNQFLKNMYDKTCEKKTSLLSDYSRKNIPPSLMSPALSTASSEVASGNRNFGELHSEPSVSSPMSNYQELKNLPANTAASNFIVRLNSLIYKISFENNSRKWYVFCVKPNGNLSPQRFDSDYVRNQVKRFDLPLILRSNYGNFPVKFKYDDFIRRYFSLSPVRAEDKSTVSTIQLAKSIYQSPELVVAGQKNTVLETGKEIYLSESLWWALEQKLVSLELTARNQKKADPKHKNQFIHEAGSSIESTLEVSGSTYFGDVMNDEDSESISESEDDGKKDLTAQRRFWLVITAILTWWIPDFLIKIIGRMRKPEIIQAWREKLALNIVILMLSALMLFLIIGYGEVLCPRQFVFTEIDLQVELNDGNRFMAIHGDVYDVTAFSHEPLPNYMYEYAAQDVSKYFPLSGGCQNLNNDAPRLRKRAPIPTEATQTILPPEDVNTIEFVTTAPVETDVSTATTEENLPEETPSSANTTRNCPDDPFDCHIEEYSPENILKMINEKRLPIIKVGKFVFGMNEVARHNKRTDLYVVINDKVYDVTTAVNGFLPKEVSQLFIANAGSTISEAVPSGVMECLDARYLRGSLDNRGSIQCQVASYSLLGLTAVFCAVMLVKFLAALQLGGTRVPEDIDRHCIIQIPCYTENEESLKKTLNSCASLNYSDKHKLLLIICDGMIKGSGNDKVTPEIVLDILGVENAGEKLSSDELYPPLEYLALGSGINRLNRAKVFTGYYEYKTNRAPFVVIVKCGRENESMRPGNRGKRDSQLVMMNFLNKVYYNRPLVPLEYEIQRQMSQNLNLDARNYEYCLMVDADTEVVEDSLKRLVAVMLHDSLIMGVCGETTIENEKDSWVTAIQVYEYYISHHLSKAFESLFGSVTCLPGCFCMYRVKSPGKKSIPLLVGDNIIQEYEENQVDTLHKKNLLSLGEDRYLTTLMLKNYPGYRNKFTRDASCKTIVPDQFKILLSQRRRWINSTVHNLWELLLVPQLCGCLCFSMRLVVALDLFGTLVMPASLLYLCYLAYLSARENESETIVTSMFLFAAIYGMQSIIFLMRGKWDMIGWMVIYILSLPIYGLILPLYSFWHFDDFSWGNTRVVVGEKAKTKNTASSDLNFDEKSIPLRKWDSESESNSKPIEKSSSTNRQGESPNQPTSAAYMYPPSIAMIPQMGYGYPPQMYASYGYQGGQQPIPNTSNMVQYSNPYHPMMYHYNPAMLGQVPMRDAYGDYIEAQMEEISEAENSSEAPISPSSAKLQEDGRSNGF